MVRYIVDGNSLEVAMDNKDNIDPNVFIIEVRYCTDSELRYLIRGIEIGQRWDDTPICLFQTREECVYYIKGIVLREYEGSDI